MEKELSVKLQPEFSDGLAVMIKRIEDSNIITTVLLQILNWFKTNHQQLPLLLEDPFNNEDANALLKLIVDYMKEEKIR